MKCIVTASGFLEMVGDLYRERLMGGTSQSTHKLMTSKDWSACIFDSIFETLLVHDYLVHIFAHIRRHNVLLNTYETVYLFYNLINASSIASHSIGAQFYVVARTVNILTRPLLKVRLTR
jgi:hypothetical protein